MPSCAKSTNKLGLGGLAPAIAKNVQGGAKRGADNFCLLLLAFVSLLEEGGGSLFQGLNCLRQLLEGFLDLLEVQIGGGVNISLGRGIALAYELFDNWV